MVASDSKLVVKHEILSAADAQKISKEFNTPLEKFPKILDTDPQAAKLKAKPGQLIAIHRNDGGAEYMYYRFVVESM
ncbi:MAG: DNA-directed RNA polymerase subunit H [Candidatus Marsarchaeota archaeon]|nr:DNA-directed RNA polymerase subunit H [Candidatus Marsarchaeota archaeon]MCL5114956.1 DNA-directed RNA polymerase subunit H [Candidatus Marsarchaeota archaeon]